MVFGLVEQDETAGDKDLQVVLVVVEYYKSISYNYGSYAVDAANEAGQNGGSGGHSGASGGGGGLGASG